jgi:small nuclear ribonucleoprotein (snRNP)-like protein
MASENKKWQSFKGEKVIIDTNSSYIYMGTLKSSDDSFVTLSDVDVHDNRESASTKEQYINQTRKNGIHKNRNEVIIRKEQVISFSRMDDVIPY